MFGNSHLSLGMFSKIQSGKNGLENGLRRSRLNCLGYGYARDLQSTVIALEWAELEFFQSKVEGDQLEEVFERLRSEREHTRSAEEALMEKAELLRKSRAGDFEVQVQHKMNCNESFQKVIGRWLCIEADYDKWLEKHISRLSKELEVLKLGQLRYKGVLDIAIMKSIIKEKLMANSLLLQKFKQELESLENVSIEESSALAARTSSPCEANDGKDLDRLRLAIEEQEREEICLDKQIEGVEEEILAVEADEYCCVDFETSQEENVKRVLTEKKLRVERLQEQATKLEVHAENQEADSRELQLKLSLLEKELKAQRELPSNKDEAEISEVKRELSHLNEENTKLQKLNKKLTASLETAKEKHKLFEEEQRRYTRWEKSAMEQKASLKTSLTRQSKISEQLQEEEKQCRNQQKERQKQLEQLKRQQRSEETRAEANKQLKRKAEKKKLALMTELEEEAGKLQEKQKTWKDIKEREMSVKVEYQTVEEDVKRLKTQLQEVGAEFEANKEKIIMHSKSFNP